MAAAVAAAAIWRERTGDGQDVAVDLREAVYNVNPLMTPIMQVRLAKGAVSPDDPVALGFTFTPTINGNLYQAPVGLGNPFSFVPFRTRDGRYMNITAAYPLAPMAKLSKTPGRWQEPLLTVRGSDAPVWKDQL